MSEAAETTVPFASPAQPAEEKRKEPKPSKTLPTNRVAFAKQLEIARAFGALSGPEGKAVSNVDVSKVVNLHSATVGLATPFLTDAGFLKKGNEGLLPAEEVGEFSAAYEWNPETAFTRCAPIIRRTWFFAALEPKLRFNPMSKAAAIQELAMAAGAGPSYKTQIETLIDYMVLSGVVSSDGDQLRLARQSQASEGSRPMATPRAEPTAAAEETFPRAAVNSSFTSQPAGVVAFNISVKVDMAELAGWEPTRIAAFFAGIAQVLSAKGAIEERTAGR